MEYRAPRPIKALRGLYLAWKGDWYELYRVPYVDEITGAGAHFVWVEGPDIEPTPYANPYQFYFDSSPTYIVDREAYTEIRGEKIPLYDLALVENPDADEEVVTIPEKFLEKQFGPVDRRGEIFQ